MNTELLALLQAAKAALSQPVQFTGTTTEEAVRILRSDARMAVSLLEKAIAALNR